MTGIGIRFDGGLKKPETDHAGKPGTAGERRGGARGDKLEYFRKLLLDHLDSMDGREKQEIKKSIRETESLAKGGLPPGTRHTWKNGTVHVKLPSGKWRPVYEGHSRGAKMAISAIKKKIAAAKDEHEMMRIVLANRDRFSDKEGHPLPFVQELSKYVTSEQDVRDQMVKQQRKKKQDKKKTERGKAAEKKKEAAETPKNRPQEGKAVQPTTGEDGDSQVNTPEKGAGDKDARKIIDPEQQAEVKKKLEDLAVPMMEVEYSKDEYNRLFPEGTVKTPLKTVKMGSDQFAKLGRKDSGDRQSYIGAAYQTLTDPIVIIKEGDEDVYIKSFTGKNGIKTFVSVEKNKDDERIIVTNYRRNEREILKKIKWADSIAYLKDNRGGPAGGNEGKPLADEGDNHLSTVSPESGEKSSDFDKIRARYQSARSEIGDEDEIQAGKELLPGVWKLVEADTPTASHDETTFHKTPGFPANEDGSTINDRDYGHDKAAQEAVMSIGAEFDGRALKVDNPVIVTEDGIVISGNNRTMSSKIAARKGTDKAYIEALKKRAKKFGFTEEQVGRFKNPRVVFEVENKNGYTTEQFAKFNQSGKKEMGPTEKAVKVSKLIKAETVEDVAAIISGHDTMGELYQSGEDTYGIIGAFVDAGLIGENESGRYWENGSITEDGKTFIETALLGSVMSEANIRGFSRPGCKNIRATLVRAITPLIDNKALEGYSINRELNEAVDIAMQVAIGRKEFKSVAEFAKQKNMFETLDPVAVELAKKLEGTQKGFAEFMQSLNGGLKVAANGEADIFLGGVESRDDILSRFLNVRKSVWAALRRIPMPDLVKSLLNFEREAV
jgi:hypothetical protein